MRHKAILLVVKDNLPELTRSLQTLITRRIKAQSAEDHVLVAELVKKEQLLIEDIGQMIDCK